MGHRSKCKKQNNKYPWQHDRENIDDLWYGFFRYNTKGMEKKILLHSSILPRKVQGQRSLGWQATVHGAAELDTT